MTRSALLFTLLLTLTACQRADSDAQTAQPKTDTSHVGMDHAGMDHGSAGHDMMGQSSYTDLTFLDRMTAHHQMALDMALLADERAGSDGVRTLGREIVAAQRAEIDTMRAWRARHFPDAPAPGPMTPDDMAAMGMGGMDMDALGAARGAAFDRMFQQQMIPHHAGAITMAAEAQMRSERAEIRDLAAEIISAQAREIGEMQANIEAMPAGAPGP